MLMTNNRLPIQAPASPGSVQRFLWDPEWKKGTNTRLLILAVMAMVWLAIVLTVTMHHEFSRDEVRAFSIAIAAPSMWKLPEFLNNEGHPIVWYALLRMGHQILGSSLALPVVSLLAAGSAVVIFLFRSPFSFTVKFLFILSVLPLYEYSVMARNYGISMLLMFGFAAAYPQRRKHPLVLAVLLSLLANTNVHSLPVAVVLLALWLWDEAVVDRQDLSIRHSRLLGIAVIVVLAAVAFSVVTILPDERTIVTNVLHDINDINFRTMKYFFAKILFAPWQTMGDLIPIHDSALNERLGHLLQTLFIGSLLLGLVVRIRFALGFLTAFLAFGFIFDFVYDGDLRHRGILLIFVLVMYWLNADKDRAVGNTFPVRLNRLALMIILPLTMLWGDCLAYNKITRDYNEELSSCKSLGNWLIKRPAYKNAIIVGEPDYILEALPYYTTQRIFIPREALFRNWVKFTTESRPVISIGELLDIAQSLKSKEHQPVLVALGLTAGRFEQKSPEIYSYNKTLEWTPSDWQRFGQSTNRVAEFRSSTDDENFDLYEIK